MKNLLCLTGFAFFAITASAQEYKIEPGVGELIAPSSGSYVGGNSFVISGYVSQGYQGGMIYRTNATSLAWATKVFALSEFQGQTITANGDVVSVGQANGDALIVRLSQTGSTLWTKVLETDSLGLLRGVAEDANGNLVAVGGQHSQSSTKENEFVIKLDPSGNVLWSREVLPPFGSVDPANRFNKVIIDGDTIFAFGTRQNSSGPTEISIGKFSSDGNYSEFYTVGSISSEIFCDVTMSGQDFVISYIMGSFTGLIRLDHSISMLASVQLTPTLGVGTLGMSGGIVSCGNNFIICGERASGSGPNNSFAAAVDQNFSPQWAEIVEANASATVKPIVGSMGQVMIVGASQVNFGAVMSLVDGATGFPVMGSCEPPQAFSVTKTPNTLNSVSINRSAVPVNFANIGTVTLVPYQPGFDLCGVTPLPIHLLSFTAKAVGHDVLLEWSTATEQNNDHYTIEKSRDGQSFEEVVRVNGAGNSVSTQSYDAVDHHPYTGESYYRLKQTDTDGAYTYSDLVTVTVDTPVELVVWPNPIGNGQILNLPADNGGYELRDAIGRLVSVVHGTTTEISGLSSGWYTVQSIVRPDAKTKFLVTF